MLKWREEEAHDIARRLSIVALIGTVTTVLAFVILCAGVAIPIGSAFLSKVGIYGEDAVRLSAVAGGIIGLIIGFPVASLQKVFLDWLTHTMLGLVEVIKLLESIYLRKL